MRGVIQTVMSELTEATRNHVAALFRKSEVAEAEGLLASECGEKTRP